ncbi:jg21490 [Pararge aegeria aegeria]|uniref:Jg21490 protein n=2 Tax=Pararge aegeria TaxID=116150 RepID=A0A8S4RPQ1_9NEOP|nr:jg21490 [Pararge aegeria aegeria]
MDHKELGTTSSVSTSVSDGSTKFALNSPTVHSSRSKSYDVGSNSLGKVDTTAARPCAIIGPDRVLPPNPDDTMYLKKVPGEAWPPPENIYRRPPDYPSKVSDYQPTRNISPRQTFQENMQRIMVPPTYSSMKSSDESSLKNTKLNMPQEAKYCDVPYNINSVNSEHKSARNPDIPMSNVNPSYTRNMPPPYGWPGNVNVRSLRPYGAPEFYQYQDFPSCAGPRPMTMIRPHRPLHEESAQVYSERLYQDANIRFKPYPTGKEKQQQPRYDYISNYPSTFHPPASIPPHKYDLQKTIHGHPYPVYPSVPFKYLDRRIHEPFVDGYHRAHNPQSNFNAFHNQVVPPPYGPIPGNCMQTKTYSDASSKSMNVNKMQFENNNKVYLNLESRNKNYPVPENIYYTDMNHSQAMRGEILLPTHSTVNIHPVPQHSIYRKDNTPLKPYDYNPNFRMFDHVNHSLQRLPLQFSPNTISSSDSNTSNETIHTIGTSQEDCGYVSQSSTASIRSLDSANMPISHNELYRRHTYNNYDMFRSSFHPNGPIQNSKNRISSSNKKNLDVRQFLQMWNEGDEEVSEANKEAATQNHTKKLSQNEIINNQEQLYVLGSVTVPCEELGKYDHIQKISKLPENIKGYNSLEILNQYEELLEAPHVNNFSKSREYSSFPKSVIDKGIISNLPRPVSPLDVEAKISQSVIHKEVGCNFEIKPCSPEMLNVELAAPVQNILGERMIEKVANPIMTKSPNLIRTENKKSQNTVNDEIKVASCKMMSEQYSSKGSLKTSNYSMQDLESNAGLCLASLPQLDNDIELNFPEINQQFIKANQMESNFTPAVQNLLNIGLDTTHKCLSHEVKNDSQQNNLSRQLASVGDKEFSKLSKYRKGRKSELTSSRNIPNQDMILTKTGESIRVLQRIDSVIIKNPDTMKSHYNDSLKISSDSNSDIKYQEDAKQSYSYLKYEKNDEKRDLSTETAIDFSLSRSEDETAVRYLNSIDGNQNLPQLEGFDEAELNVENHISCGSELQNAPTNNNSIPCAEVLTGSQSENSPFKITDEYENDKQNTSQEITENQYDGLIKVPEKSPKVNEENEEYNVLVIKKLTTPEREIPEKVTSSENTKTIESSFPSITNINSECQESKEEYLYQNSIDRIHSNQKMYVEKDKPESDNESKRAGIFRSVNSDTDYGEQYNRDEFEKGKQNEIISGGDDMVLEMSFDAKSCDAYFENNYSMDVTQKQDIQDVLKDISSQDIVNLNNESGMSYHTAKSNITEDSEANSDNSQKNNEEMTENKSNVLLVSETYKKIGVVLEKNYITDIDQSVTSVPNAIDIKNELTEEELATVVSQQDPETKMMNTSDNMSSTSLEIDYVKNEPNLTITARCDPESMFNLSEVIPNQDSEIKIGISALECLSDNSVINKCNETVFPAITCLVTLDSKHESAQIGCGTKLDTPTAESLPNESVFRTCDLKNETHFLIDETENIKKSFVELLEPKGEISATIREKNHEIDMDVDESECLSGKTEIHAITAKISGEIPDEIIAEYRHETDKDRYPNRNLHTNLDPVIPDCLCDKYCIESITVEDSCLINKNINSFENHSDNNAELKNETDINTVESKFLSDIADVNAIEPVKNSFPSNNKIIGENLTVNIKEYSQGIELDGNIQTDFEANVAITDSECLSDPIKNLEPFFSLSNEHTQESSTVKTTELNKMIERQDNNIDKELELDKHSSNVGPDMDNCFKYKDSHSVIKDETKSLTIKNEVITQSCKTYVNSYATQHNLDYVHNERTYCKKELFSPWFQKLLMFTEGVCESIKNKNFNQEDNFDKDKIDYLFHQNDKVVMPQNDIEEFKLRYELNAINKEADLSNNHDRFVTNKVSPHECHENQDILHDSDNINDKFKNIKNDFYKIPPVLNDTAIVKPRKISKRSLSESALESYKDNDDINLVQACKRKKYMIGEQSILDSHIIGEDICNIFQTNRRNSISTFYNEDNVYIVIENDLILAEEHDDRDKICFTESTEEFLTSIESINCEINLNLGNDSITDEPNQICEYSNTFQHIEERSIEDSWVEDVACIETVFSEDVAENIIIDVQPSPKKVKFSDPKIIDEESTVFFDSDHHIDKIKSIYGHSMCNDNSELIETLYRTPQMNVNKTLYHIESQDPKECIDAIIENCIEPCKAHDNDTGISETGKSSYEVVGNKENMSENVSLNSKQCNQNIIHNKECNFKEFCTEEQEDKLKIHSSKPNNDQLMLNFQKENLIYSCSSSPEVSSTTSEEKNSILLKITNCNGSRVSQINEVSTDSQNKLSYKLTEKGEYRKYSSNFSSRTLITKAAQKYIPPLKETTYDLKVKLPLPQHRLHTLKQLKIAKVKPKVALANICTVKKLNHDKNKKQKPKFEDVLKSIDEINFKKHRDINKKGKTSIPKVIIKKNENGAHYASSKTTNTKETYNPDLTGRKWQPWVFLEKNNFVDRMALQNKAKAVFCHRKNNYVLLEKFRKYKSVYNANFVISQPKSDTKGNLKYTIRLKNIN